jgi:uncharacterized phosphosugar-binding protein
MSEPVTIETYANSAIPHLQKILKANHEVLARLSSALLKNVKEGGKLLVFGSGHSSIFSFELYHRAGGPSFVIPLVADFLLPSAGPPVVRVMERTAGSANFLLDRSVAQKGEMLWLCSQSGINAAVVDLAMEAKRRGLVTVAFSSRAHSESVKSRHASGKRLFEVCDELVDLGGVSGDAAVPVSPNVAAGPLSSLGAIFLGHSLLVDACAKLEQAGVGCVYTSVNTPDGEARNLSLEAEAKKRDWRLL